MNQLIKNTRLQIKTLLNNYISLFSKIRTHDFAKNVFTLFKGSGLSQLITLCGAIILARIYSEADLGIFFIFLTLIILGAIPATLRLETAIMIAKSDTEAKQLVWLCTYINIINSILFTLFIYFLYPYINLIHSVPNLSEFVLFMLPVNIFLTGIAQTLQLWLNRNKQYATISQFSILKSAGIIIPQILFGLIKLKSVGLLTGFLIGQLISTLFIILVCLPNIKTTEFNFSSFKNIFLSYKEFAFYLTPNTITNTLSNQLPVILLTKFFGLTTTGLYGTAQRVVGTPISLVGQSISQVYFQQLSELHQQGSNLYLYLIKTYKSLLKLIIAPAIIAIIVCPFLFSWILGNNWYNAGIYASILIPFLTLGFINMPTGSVFVILRKQKMSFLLDLVVLSLRFFSLYLGYVFHNPLLAIALFSGTGVIVNTGMIFLSLKLCKTQSA